MKLLHTSDWHLGKRLENFSRLDEQQSVLKEINEIADHEQVDAILIAGDLFDTFNPSTEAVDLFYKSLKKLTRNGKRPVIAIAGNHDSPDRIEAPDPLARECGIIFAGYPHSVVPEFELESGLKIIHSEAGFVELQLPENVVPLRILLTPYANEFRLKTYLGQENSEEELRLVLQKKWKDLAEKFCDNQGVNVLVSHLFMMKKGGEIPEEPADEKPILHVGGVQAVYTENLPNQLDYVALGHLHRLHTIDSKPCPIVYCGSPLSYSFSEAGQEKYAVVVEAHPGQETKIFQFRLNAGKKLSRYRAEGVEDALNWLSQHQEDLVELTMVTETFLTVAERKQLYVNHPGIVCLIPEVKNIQGLACETDKGIDLSQEMDALFRDYFRYVKNQDPNEEIMDLFAEILAGGEE